VIASAEPKKCENEKYKSFFIYTISCMLWDLDFFIDLHAVIYFRTHSKSIVENGAKIASTVNTQNWSINLIIIKSIEIS